MKILLMVLPALAKKTILTTILLANLSNFHYQAATIQLNKEDDGVPVEYKTHYYRYYPTKFKFIDDATSQIVEIDLTSGVDVMVIDNF